MLMPNESPVNGLNVFVVEDESLVLFNLEDILTELGCIIIGPAMRLPQAQELVDRAAEADVAILDVNLGGQPVFPVAEALRQRGVDIVFATGYGREGLPDEWQRHPVLRKPYTAGDVEKALATVAIAKRQ
jgi:CheY-like chemotaxis protein